MNIETANRLCNLRKEHNLSQEQLAEKVGVSRQAVSKWERGEASPDTDNLIILAKIYGVSVDEILTGNSEKADNGSNSDNFNDNSRKDSNTVNSEYTFVKSKETVKTSIVIEVMNIIVPVIAVIIFLILGFVFNQWKVSWIIFLFIPIYYSTVSAIKNKKLSNFCYPVLMVIIFMLLGFWFNLWYIVWIVFVSIPVFYGICRGIEK